MTTEQLLSHLGIEVDQEFGIDDTTYNGYSYHFDGKVVWEYDQCKNVMTSVTYTLAFLLDKALLPHPKYTLTEEDKEALRSLDKDVVSLIKTKICEKNDYVFYWSWNKKETYTNGCLPSNWLPIKPNLFSFMDRDVIYDVDELRKCL